jgi:hypothetical protein
MIYSPPVPLDSKHCAAHRETLLLSLEGSDKQKLDECLSSLLNTNAEGHIHHIARSGLGVVVKDIALATPAEITKTAKRLALVLSSEWMDLIRAEHERRDSENPVSNSCGRAFPAVR